ncbi:MAG: AAA family ATPase [Actinobacteria bacterium]|nr:AAA family ATPase [Actinomycetota bacterium]
MNLELRTLDEITEDTTKWLVDKLVCPWITLVSGQPKYGKSALIGHISMALINNTDFLGRKTKPGNHKIAWMGYDAGWKQEITMRWKEDADNRIVTYDPIRSLDVEIWRELAESLQSTGVTLFVLDHLYGMAGALGLNDAEQFAVLANLIRPIYEEFGIAVLLLAQAGKGEFSRGRAAHSVAIEGEARALIRIYEKRSKGARKIELSSNTNGEETLSVTLTPEVIEIKEGKSLKKEDSSQRESPEAVRGFLCQANPSELTSWSGVGRELHRLNLSVSPSAGRQMSTRWREQNLIKMDSGVVVAGDSLLPPEFLTNPYKSINATSDYLPTGVYERVNG